MTLVPIPLWDLLKWTTWMTASTSTENVTSQVRSISRFLENRLAYKSPSDYPSEIKLVRERNLAYRYLSFYGGITVK